eukprot:794828-Rhodomonas_salina.1
MDKGPGSVEGPWTRVQVEARSVRAALNAHVMADARAWLEGPGHQHPREIEAAVRAAQQVLLAPPPGSIGVDGDGDDNVMMT